MLKLDENQKALLKQVGTVRVECCPEDFVWMLPHNDIWVWSHGLKAFYSMETPLRLLRRRRVVLQAGGCYGFVPGQLARIFQKVVTFEPDPDNYRYLQANCARFGNVAMMPEALGADETCTLMRLPIVHADGSESDHINGGLTRVVPDDNGQVVSRSIDSLCLPVLDALILDAEGSEPAIIEGAADTLERCRPEFVICETVDDTMLSLLARLDYRRGPDLGGDSTFWNWNNAGT